MRRTSEAAVGLDLLVWTFLTAELVHAVALISWLQALSDPSRLLDDSPDLLFSLATFVASPLRSVFTLAGLLGLWLLSRHLGRAAGAAGRLAVLAIGVGFTGATAVSYAGLVLLQLDWIGLEHPLLNPPGFVAWGFRAIHQGGMVVLAAAVMLARAERKIGRRGLDVLLLAAVLAWPVLTIAHQVGEVGQSRYWLWSIATSGVRLAMVGLLVGALRGLRPTLVWGEAASPGDWSLVHAGLRWTRWGILARMAVVLLGYGGVVMAALRGGTQAVPQIAAAMTVLGALVGVVYLRGLILIARAPRWTRSLGPMVVAALFMTAALVADVVSVGLIWQMLTAELHEAITAAGYLLLASTLGQGAVLLSLLGLLVGLIRLAQALELERARQQLRRLLAGLLAAAPLAAGLRYAIAVQWIVPETGLILGIGLLLVALALIGLLLRLLGDLMKRAQVPVE